MTTLQQFKDDFARQLFGQTSTEAQDQGICIECKQPAVLGVNIFTPAGSREYKISGLCEVCFDKIFEESEEL